MTLRPGELASSKLGAALPGAPPITRWTTQEYDRELVFRCARAFGEILTRPFVSFAPRGHSTTEVSSGRT